MGFRRKAYDELLEWKVRSEGRSAIMVQGARRVGKTTLVEKFAREQYRSYVLIDFSEDDAEIRHIFKECRADLNMLFNRLQLKTRIKLYERESVIIFDEVQEFPSAREMIKILVKDGRYDYIETGSLIHIKTKVSGIRVPSEEQKLDMHPMDFQEWLWANGADVTADMLKTTMDGKESVGDVVHRSILRKYAEYMIVGGMPQAVSAYVQKHDILEVEGIKRDIIDLYRDDIRKIHGRVMERASDLFDSIPVLLSSQHKVLSPVKIKTGTRMRDYNAALEWLCDAGIINVCRCYSDPNCAAVLSENESRVKCYLFDTGLLFSLAFRNDMKGLSEAFGLLLDGKLSVNKGMLFENMVAQELVSKGYDLWFTEFEKKDSKRKYEVDFILPCISKIIPMEVKSGKSVPHASLDKLISKYDDCVEKAYVIHSKDLRVDGKITYVPIYMMQFADWY